MGMEIFQTFTPLPETGGKNNPLPHHLSIMNDSVTGMSITPHRELIIAHSGYSLPGL